MNNEPLCVIFKRLQKRKESQTEDRISIGLFHPYCNAGSGAERVLWVALKCLQTRYPSAQFILYTGDTGVSPEEILAKTHHHFNLTLPLPVQFVYLHRRKWVEDWSYFTHFGQSVGSLFLGMEALFKFVPDVYIDTMGYTLTLPLFKYFGSSRVGSYIHSPPPFTSSPPPPPPPLHLLQGRSPRAPFSLYTSIHTILGAVHARLFSKCYAWAASAADILMVNSSWTEEHILTLWQCPSRTYRIFPPCDIEGFRKAWLGPEVEVDRPSDGTIKIVSIGEFRVEKDHPLQLRALYQLRELLGEDEWGRVSLVVMGATRDKEELGRVKDMEDLAKHLSLERNVRFRVNVSHEELIEELGGALIGLHTMWNEQFGIGEGHTDYNLPLLTFPGVVECMAAGLIVVVNRSGGPLSDIVMEYDGARNGFLATDEGDYAETIRRIIQLTPECRNRIKSQAVASVNRFSERQFTKGFLEAVQSSLFR